MEEKKTMAGPAAADEFAAFVAIDWGNSEHHWALQAAGGQKREHGKLAHTPEAIEEWASSLARRFGERAVAVALEQSRGALVCALSRYRHLTIYPIPPAASAGFRAFASPSGSEPSIRPFMWSLVKWLSDGFTNASFLSKRGTALTSF